jgi:hypothetical protein
MAYLNRQIPTLLYNGYFKKDFLPDGTFTVTSDLQTIQDLSKENPTLYQRWKPENFMRGGSFYKYGMIDGIGNWVFKLDPEPMRFQDLGGGIIGRVRAYQNEAATEGKKPVYDTNYDLARYQFYHVWARAAREVHVGDLSPVNSDMSFKVSRNLMGKWSWQNPDYFKATDPCSGEVCEYENYKKNKGFFLGEFEAGLKTIYPEIEMWILAQREPQQVIDVPACSDESEVYYQTDLYPYNCDYCTE